MDSFFGESRKIRIRTTSPRRNLPAMGLGCFGVRSFPNAKVHSRAEDAIRPIEAVFGDFASARNIGLRLVERACEELSELAKMRELLGL